MISKKTKIQKEKNYKMGLSIKKASTFAYR